MTDTQLFLPVLDKIKETAPEFKLRYWDKDLKIEDNLITWYTGGSTSGEYTNAKALNLNLTLDMWSSNILKFTTASILMLNGLDYFVSEGEVEDVEFTLKVTGGNWREMEKDKDTGLYRRNFTIGIVVIFN